MDCANSRKPVRALCQHYLCAGRIRGIPVSRPKIGSRAVRTPHDSRAFIFFVPVICARDLSSCPCLASTLPSGRTMSVRITAADRTRDSKTKSAPATFGRYAAHGDDARLLYHGIDRVSHGGPPLLKGSGGGSAPPCRCSPDRLGLAGRVVAGRDIPARIKFQHQPDHYKDHADCNRIKNG